MYHRIVCVVPYVGQGTDADPKRPKHAPWPTSNGQSRSGIIACTQVPSDDGRFAIVEFVAYDASAFGGILQDRQVRSLLKNRTSKSQIESEIRRYKRGFDLDKFTVVAR